MSYEESQTKSGDRNAKKKIFLRMDNFFLDDYFSIDGSEGILANSALRDSTFES